MGTLIVSVVMVTLISGSVSQSTSSLAGREFIFGIIDTDLSMYWTRPEMSNNTIALHLTNLSPNTTRLRLEIPFSYIDIYYSIQADHSLVLPVNENIQERGNFIARREIRITSNNAITVLVTCMKVFSNRTSVESYNILPVISAGRRFLFTSTGVIAYNGNVATVLITNFHKNADVRLYNTSGALVKAVSLGKLDVYQYQWIPQDGFLLEATEDLSVVLGYSFYNGNVLQAECMTSSMIPTNSWSKSYIVPPLIVAGTSQIRVLSDNIFLKVAISNGTSSYSVFSPQNKRLIFENQTVVVKAKYPFAVTQHNYFFNTYKNDNFMTMVPGLDQYINDYRFTVPEFRSNVSNSTLEITNYVAVIVPKTCINGLLLNNSPLQSVRYPIAEFPVPSPFSNYTVLTFQTGKGYHRIHHPTTNVKFGVFVYGYGHSGSGGNHSYGFYAGFHLQGSGSISPTFETSSTQSPFKSTTSLMPRSTDGHKELDPGNKTVCYSCENLLHADLCDDIKQCKANEMCFMERRRISDQTVYRSGCLSHDLCSRLHQHSQHNSDDCVECCSGSFCNNQGCGVTGLPDLSGRGPVCYDCQHVWSPDECNSVTLCSRDQICRIEKFAWGDHYQYKMGCANIVCDPLTRRIHHLSKRATPLCRSCCNEDYCNRNCTQNSQGAGSVFIG